MLQVETLLKEVDSDISLAKCGRGNISLTTFYKNIYKHSLKKKLSLAANNSKTALRLVNSKLNDYVSRKTDPDSTHPDDVRICLLFLIIFEGGQLEGLDGLSKKITDITNVSWAKKLIISGLLQQELFK